MDLDGRTALITGGATRVGRAIGLALAEAGCHIVIHYHSSETEAESTTALIQSMGRNCQSVQADLSDSKSIAGMLDGLNENHTHIDILVNSASVYYETPLLSITAQQWDDNLNVNLRAPFLLAQALGPAMASRGAGKIINIADCSVKRVYRNFLPYLVSKVALVGLTETLALELAPMVQVNTIAPGTVLLSEEASEILREQCIKRSPLKRLGTPEEVAALVRYLVCDGDFVTGGYYAVDGGAGIR